MSSKWLSPDDARKRFGRLTITRGAVKTHLEFVDEDNFVWYPVYGLFFAELIGYARRVGDFDEHFPGAPADLKFHQRKV